MNKIKNFLLINLFFTGAFAQNQVNLESLKTNTAQLLESAKNKSQQALQTSKTQAKKVLKFAKAHKKAIGVSAAVLSTCGAIYGIGYIEARAKGGTDNFAKKYGFIFGLRKLFLAPPIRVLNKTVTYLENSEKMQDSKLTKKLESLLRFAGKFSDEDIFKYMPTNRELKLEGSQRYHLTMGEIMPPDTDNWQYYAEIRDKYFWW